MTWKDFFCLQDHYEESWFTHRWQDPVVHGFPKKGSVRPIGVSTAYAAIFFQDSPNPSGKWYLYSMQLYNEKRPEWKMSQLCLGNDVIQGNALHLDMCANELAMAVPNGGITIFPLPMCRSGKNLQIPSHQVRHMRLSQRLVITNQGAWDRKRSRWITPLPVPESDVSTLSFVSNLRFLIGCMDGSIVDVGYGEDGILHVCARHSGEFLFTQQQTSPDVQQVPNTDEEELPPPHAEPLWTVSGTPGGQSLTATTKNQLVLFDANTRKMVRVPNAGSIMHTVSAGNITVLHHISNHLLFVNRFNGQILQTFQNPDVLRHTEESTHAYTSIRFQCNLLTVLFPSGLLMFIHLKSDGSS